MQAWSLPLPFDRAPSPVQAGLSRLIGAIGRDDFALQALHALNGALAAASWAVYQRFADRAPVLHLSGSCGVADTTRACFAAYRDAGLYRRDASLDAAHRSRAGQAVLLRMHERDAPNADHREAIYRRHHVLERLSVASKLADDSVLAINLYHHTHQGCFGEPELANFAELAPALLAGVQRHIELRTRAASPRDALRARCAALTERELDVLERLLKGMSYDGIAADMGLSLATVKTYRARAFERLGLHFKSELFAAFVPAH